MVIGNASETRFWPEKCARDRSLKEASDGKGKKKMRMLADEKEDVKAADATEEEDDIFTKNRDTLFVSKTIPL